MVSEYEDRTVACFEEEGLTVTPVDGVDGPPWEIGRGGLDDAAYEPIIDMCIDRVGDPPIAPVTPEEASGMYDLTLELAACLEAHGVTVADPPSREQWVEIFLEGEPPWTPYESDPQSFGRFSSDCGQPELADLPPG